MNDTTLIHKLRCCKNGMFVIPFRTDEQNVYDMWDKYVSRRDRRTLRFTLTLTRNGMIANIKPRPGIERERREAMEAAVLFVLAVLFFMFAFYDAAVRPLPTSPMTLEERHECLRNFGEACPL